MMNVLGRTARMRVGARRRNHSTRNAGRRLALRAVLALSFVVAALAPSAAFAAPVRLDFDTLPPAPWTRYDCDAGGTATVARGVLTLDSPTCLEYELGHPNGTWHRTVSNARGWAVEARLRVRQASGDPDTCIDETGVAVWAYDHTVLLIVGITPGAVCINYPDSVAYRMDTTNAFHTYRIATKGMRVRISVDGIVRIDHALSTPGDGSDVLMFGDLSGSGATLSDWDYFEYDTFAPSYSIAPVGPQGGRAVDVNGAGQVAGWGGPPIDNTDVSWIAANDGTHFTACDLAFGGINSYGVVTGKASPPGETYPCVYDYRTDSWHHLDFTPYQNAGGGGGINDHGDVAGWWGTNPSIAVLWTKQDDGTYRGRALGTLGGDFAHANDTAAPGEAVGAAQNGSGYWRAFSYSGGRMRGLGTLGGRNSEALRVSGGPGYIVGWAQTSAGVRHAFRYIDGHMRDLGTLGGARSEAKGVNRFGTVVGSARTPSGAQRAFVWRNRTMYNLNDLIPKASGWLLVEATGINGKGQIVGWGYHDGSVESFLLTPAA